MFLAFCRLITLFQGIVNSTMLINLNSSMMTMSCMMIMSGLANVLIRVGEMVLGGDFVALFCMDWLTH